VGRDLSAVVLGTPEPPGLDGPVYFTTDDDISRGLDQKGNLIGLAYASVVQPNHIETVVARLGDTLWKYSRYFDNPVFWSEQGEKDEVLQELGKHEDPGTYVALVRKTVKETPVPEQLEMYDLTRDPMELVNLSGKRLWSEVEAKLRKILAEQCSKKRLSPRSGAVPGQVGCG